MKDEERFFRPIVYVIFATYIVASYTVLAFDNRILGITVREDRLFETLGAMALFATSALFFICFLRSLSSVNDTASLRTKKLFFLVLTLLFLFGAGEEINWGQRIFDIKTPQWLMKINEQEEISFHNLYIFDRDRFFTMDRLFDIFWFLWVVALPVTCAIFKTLQRSISKFLPIVPLSIGVLFLLNYLWAKVAKLIFCGMYAYDLVPFKQAVQEIKESNYAVLFILVPIYFISVLKKQKTGATKSVML